MVDLIEVKGSMEGGEARRTVSGESDDELFKEGVTGATGATSATSQQVDKLAGRQAARQKH